MKSRFGLIAILMGILVMASTVFAAVDIPVTIENVEIDGSDVSTWATTQLDIKRGEDIEVDFELVGNEFMDSEGLDDVEVEVTIRGYDHNDRESLTEIIGPFNMNEGSRYRKSVELSVPQRVEEGHYLLRIVVWDKDHQLKAFQYDLSIDNRENEVMIKDVVFSPETGLKPGRALLASVRVKNYGDDTYEEDVKVSVSIPALGVSASEYIDELEAGDSVSSPELFIRIPENTKPGEYNVIVEAEYDEGDESVEELYTITVAAEVEAESVPQETTYVSGESEPQSVMVGGTGAYPITISNVGSSARTYSITVSPAEWATFKISPTNLVVVNGGESKIVYLYVTPKEGSDGEKVFVANVRSGDTMKQVPLQANVIAAEETEEPVSGEGLTKGLQIGLFVLLGLFVILAVIIIFNKITSSKDDDDDDEDDDEAQTYY